MTIAADRPERSESLANLFPAGVVVFTLSGDAAPAEVLPEERPAVSAAVAKRRVEFALGRACARAAIRSLGLGCLAIPVGSGREPVWPSGVCGSITHCAGLVAAAATREPRIESLGLDAEPLEPLEAELAARIAAPEELRRARAAAGLPTDTLGRLVFSAKEVVHKCIHPLTRETLDFSDVAIEFDRHKQAFAAHARTPRARALEHIDAIRGRYVVDGGYIVTAGAILRPH